MKYHYRCALCKSRHTFNRKIDDYIIKRKCRYCETSKFYADTYRDNKELKATCHCDGYHYPHRPNTGVWCINHKTGPSQQDFEDRYGKVG